MNHGVNISLVIVGIIFMVFPPVGMILLAIAFVSMRVNHNRHRAHHEAARAVLAQRERRARILAYKSLP